MDYRCTQLLASCCRASVAPRDLDVTRHSAASKNSYDSMSCCFVLERSSINIITCQVRLPCPADASAT